MKGVWAVPIIASILILGTLVSGITPNAYAAQGTITFVNPAEKHGMIHEDGCEGTNGECQYQFQIPQGVAPGYIPNEGDSVTFTPGPGQTATDVTLAEENNPPTIDSVTVITDAEIPGFRCTANGVSDIDGDDVTLSYEWTLAGGFVVGGDEDTLPNSAFIFGNTVTCEVTPFDGTDFGEPVSGTWECVGCGF